MPFTLSTAVRRVAALKPLVASGLLVGAVALTASGSPFAHRDIAKKDMQTRAFANQTALENEGESADVLYHGLREIARLDVTKMLPGTAAATMREMAARTLADAPFLQERTERLATPFAAFVDGDLAKADAILDERLSRQNSMDSMAVDKDDLQVVLEANRTQAALDKVRLRGSHAKESLRAISKGTMAPSSNVALADITLSELRDPGADAPKLSVAERLEASAAAKLAALTEVARVAQAGLGDPAPAASEANNAAIQGRADMPSADAVALRAIAEYYASRPDQAPDAHRAVVASAKAGVLDGYLARASLALDAESDPVHGLTSAKAIADKGIAEAEAIGATADIYASASAVPTRR